MAEPPPSLVERVMGAVLAELRPADYLPLPTRYDQARIDRIAAAEDMLGLPVASVDVDVVDVFEPRHS